MGKPVERRSIAASRIAAGPRRLRPAPIIVALLFIATVVFLIYPAVDITVSGWFFDGFRFPLRHDPTLRMMRNFGRACTFATCGLAVASLVLVVTRKWRRGIFLPHEALYVLSVYGLGPGLLVNALSKEIFSRPRPRHIELFGGNLDYSGVWTTAGACQENCSFASGEAAAVAALAALVFCLPRQSRPAAGVFVAVVIGVVSYSRVAFGGHFVSDVVMSWLIVLLVAVVVRPWFFGERGAKIDRTFAEWAEIVSPHRAALEQSLTSRMAWLFGAR